MKKVFKGLALGMALTAFAAVPAFAQSECENLYGTYTGTYNSKETAKQQEAITTGDQFLAKCSADPELKPQVDFVTKSLAALKKKLVFSVAATRYDNAVKDAKNVNADEAFAGGKELIALPDFKQGLDVILTLASIGFDKAAANPPVDKFNGETVNYAKQAIQKIEAGETSQNYGNYAFAYKTKEYPDGKSNALAWMNYIQGFILANNQKNEKDAVPFYYKALQYNSAIKNRADVYQTIGGIYLKEYNRIDDERTNKAKQAQAETNEETKKQLIEETKTMLALQKGYADRVIDAYARAYKLAPATDKPYKDSLYNILKGAYAFRNDGKADGLNEAYISGVVAKPLPDPASTVTPVVETTTATTTPATTSSTVTPATTDAKPAANTGTTNTTSKPATTKPAANTTTNSSTTTPTPAKKPATTTPKKKGTR